MSPAVAQHVEEALRIADGRHRMHAGAAKTRQRAQRRRRLHTGRASPGRMFMTKCVRVTKRGSENAGAVMAPLTTTAFTRRSRRGSSRAAGRAAAGSHCRNRAGRR